MIKNQNIIMWLITVSLLLIMAGTVMPLLRVEGDAWKYIYGSGAVVLLYSHISAIVPKGASLRLRRLYRLETWCAIFFCVATFFMFYEKAGQMDWLAFTLAGGAIQVYTSIMIPRMARKEKLIK